MADVRADGSVVAAEMPGGWPSDGVVLRQENPRREQLPACTCNVPPRQRNTYRVVPLPAGVRVRAGRKDEGGWRPSPAEVDAMQPSHSAVERGRGDGHGDKFAFTLRAG